MSAPGPWASIRPARDAARASARTEQNASARSGSTTSFRSSGSADLTPWRMAVNARGDLVAIHDNGREVTLAVNNEEV